MRRKKGAGLMTYSVPKRSTKAAKRERCRMAISNPTSPEQVCLTRVNNLNAILKPNTPIVPQAVQLGNVVQRLDAAFTNAEPTLLRRSERIRAKSTSASKESNAPIPPIIDWNL